jgi:hypothetical protein
VRGAESHVLWLRDFEVDISCAEVTPYCGYHKFHILLMEVIVAGKTRRVTLTQESNLGLADQGRRKSARECTRVDSANDPMASCTGSDPFRPRVARSGSAVPQLGARLPPVPAPVAGLAEAPVSPSPTKDADAFGDSRRSKNTGFDARRILRRRSHGPDTRAEWSLLSEVGGGRITVLLSTCRMLSRRSPDSDRLWVSSDSPPLSKRNAARDQPVFVRLSVQILTEIGMRE